MVRGSFMRHPVFVGNLKKIVVQWNGETGLPGVSVFYALAASTNPVGDLNTFFTAIRGLFATNLTWTLPGSGDLIDENSGHVTGGGWTSTGSGTVSANGGAASGPVGTGAKVIWQTAAITPKFRKVRGHTNLTQLISTQYASTGLIISTAQTTIGTAASALVASGNFAVWHRNTPGSTDGFAAGMTAATVPATVISLRSRRY